MDNSYANFYNLKEDAIEQLKSNYLKGNLKIEEYENRVAKVLNCNDIMQIENILVDLPKIEITESEIISCKMAAKPDSSGDGVFATIKAL